MRILPSRSLTLPRPIWASEGQQLHSRLWHTLRRVSQPPELAPLRPTAQRPGRRIGEPRRGDGGGAGAAAGERRRHAGSSRGDCKRTDEQPAAARGARALALRTEHQGARSPVAAQRVLSERQSTPKPKGASCGLPCLSVGVRTGLRALGAKHCAFEFAPAQHCARPLLRVPHHPTPSTTSDGQRGRAVASASPPPLRRWAGKRRGLRGTPARAVRAGGRTQGSGCDETAEAEGATRGVARGAGHRRPPPLALANRCMTDQ